MSDMSIEIMNGDNPLVAILRNAGGQMKARDCCEMLGVTRRALRRIANHSNGLVLDTNGGYVLMDSARPEQVEEGIGRLRSKAMAMLYRLSDTKKQYDKVKDRLGLKPFQMSLPMEIIEGAN